MRLTVIVPASDQPSTLRRALDAIESAADGPDEIVVIDSSSIPGPAAARNVGALTATGDILVFVDADIEVHRDAFSRIRAHFDADPSLGAVFGAYDDDPSDEGTISSFRNLLHHYVHRSGAGSASTFWSGIGAIRREAFIDVGGFNEKYIRASIEDIELGSRLVARNVSLMLDPTIEGVHLKTWTLLDMIRTDVLRRGAPWIALILSRHIHSTALNLGWRHRLNALLCLLAITVLVLGHPLLAGILGLVFVAFNLEFYALLVRRRGLAAGLAGPALHAIHYLAASVSVPVGIGMYLRARHRSEPEVEFSPGYSVLGCAKEPATPFPSRP